MDNEKQNQINIELSEEIAQGIFSNLAVISHSSSEFVIDFVRIVPGTPKAKVKSRIILTPEHAKRLQSVLQENIVRYESNFGKIPVHNQSGPMPFMNIGEPKGEA